MRSHDVAPSSACCSSTSIDFKVDQRRSRPRGRRSAARSRSRRAPARRGARRATPWPGSAATSSSSCCDGVRRRGDGAGHRRARARGARARRSRSAASERRRRRQHRHRRSPDAGRRRRRGRCCATPTSPCTAPRAPAGAASQLFDRRDCARRVVRRLELEARAARARSTHGELRRCTTSRRSTSATGRLVGVEALVRWQHPRAGWSPGEFIPVAEETGLIVPLGELGPTSSLPPGRRVAREQPERPRSSVTVNVSARQLADARLRRAVAACSSTSAGLDRRAQLPRAHRERAHRATSTARSTLLTRCAGARRVRIAIDDFGTGYSSLAYLKRFPVDVLKIDRSFVDGLGTGRRGRGDRRRRSSRMAHALGLHVVAEGVETPLQASELAALGCTIAQGYLWSRRRCRPTRSCAGGRTPSGARARPPGRRARSYLIDEMLHQIGLSPGGHEMIAMAAVCALLYGPGLQRPRPCFAGVRARPPPPGCRGFSHFGAAFMVMAFTCGPHHLVHFVHITFEGERVTPELAVALAIGVAPGITFVALRIEAACGARRQAAARRPGLAAGRAVAVHAGGGDDRRGRGGRRGRAVDAAGPACSRTWCCSSTT